MGIWRADINSDSFCTRQLSPFDGRAPHPPQAPPVRLPERGPPMPLLLQRHEWLPPLAAAWPPAFGDGPHMRMLRQRRQGCNTCPDVKGQRASLLRLTLACRWPAKHSIFQCFASNVGRRSCHLFGRCPCALSRSMLHTGLAAQQWFFLAHRWPLQPRAAPDTTRALLERRLGLLTLYNAGCGPLAALVLLVVCVQQ